MAEKESSVSSKPKDGPRKCEACEITLPDIYAYADHLESKEHTKGVMKKKYGEKYLEAKANLHGQKVHKDLEAESDKSESSSDEGEVYTCEVCEKVCTGILSYKLHLSGKKHEKNVKKAKLMKQMQIDNIIPDDDNSDEDNPLMKAIFTKNEHLSSEILCKVCNKKCPGPQAFKQHNNSESHKKKLAMQNLLKSMEHQKHTVENSESDDDAAFRCDVCSKEFSGPFPFQQHMKSAAHSKQMKQSEQLKKFKDLVINSEDGNRIQCKECNKYFSGPKPFNDHLKSSLHSKLKQKIDLLKKLKEKYPEMIITSALPLDSEDSEEEDPTIICKVCHTAFTGPESARDHFQSQKHKKVIKEKMRFEKFQLLKESRQSITKSKSKTDTKKILENEDGDLSDGFDIIG